MLSPAETGCGNTVGCDDAGSRERRKGVPMNGERRSGVLLEDNVFESRRRNRLRPPIPPRQLLEICGKTSPGDCSGRTFSCDRGSRGCPGVCELFQRLWSHATPLMGVANRLSGEERIRRYDVEVWRERVYAEDPAYSQPRGYWCGHAPGSPDHCAEALRRCSSGNHGSVSKSISAKKIAQEIIHLQKTNMK